MGRSVNTNWLTNRAAFSIKIFARDGCGVIDCSHAPMFDEFSDSGNR